MGRSAFRVISRLLTLSPYALRTVICCLLSRASLVEQPPAGTPGVGFAVLGSVVDVGVAEVFPEVAGVDGCAEVLVGVADVGFEVDVGVEGVVHSWRVTVAFTVKLEAVLSLMGTRTSKPPSDVPTGLIGNVYVMALVPRPELLCGVLVSV